MGAQVILHVLVDGEYMYKNWFTRTRCILLFRIAWFSGSGLCNPIRSSPPPNQAFTGPLDIHVPKNFPPAYNRMVNGWTAG